MVKKQYKRKKRAPRVSRTDTQRLNRASASRNILKLKVVSLESRMAVLERLVESINTPMAQADADLAREVRDDVMLWSGKLPDLVYDSEEE